VNVSRRWLEAFLGRPLEIREVSERLAMLGAPVEAVTPLERGLEAIVVGRVEEVRPHPNADRLWVCLVSDGSHEPRRVVCGAGNVQVGRLYPFAPVGATLPGGLLIGRRTIRGEASEGMLCSARELGLGEDHEGILELDGPWPPGTRLDLALELGDDRLALDVTPNRPDLLGHKGVARELAAAFDTPFRLPTLPGEDAALPAIERVAQDGALPGLRVRIGDTGVCGRFLAAVVRGVQVRPSPQWLQRRLRAVGLRPINNVVDATNWVLIELNQPMHAYDLATLGGGLIEARAARAGEVVVTLDGRERVLGDGIPVIADRERVVGIAGIMGGAETEVSHETTDVLLECAWFVPGRIRAARKELGLSTEASYRFERGTDRWNAPEALHRCLQLLLRTGGGQVEGAVDVWPGASHPPRIFLRQARVAQVLGVELSRSEIERTLVAIGATVVAKPQDQRLAVEVPGWRPDLTHEIDLVEEVARVYGYDRIPAVFSPVRPGLQTDAPDALAAARVRQAMVREGLFETLTLPLGRATTGGGIRIVNPLSAEHVELRGQLLPGLVREVERNWAAQVRDVRLFEIGTAFSPGDPGQRPIERLHLAAVVTGAREPPHWTTSGKASDVDWWDLKGLFVRALDVANPGASVQVEGARWIATAGGRSVGWAGLLEADAPPWAAPLFGLEMEVALESPATIEYRAMPVTPAIERDLALLLPQGTSAASVVDAIRSAAGSMLEEVTVVDEYRGPQLPPGARSVAVRLRFRAAHRTLRDTEVDRSVGQILETLERTLGVVLRTT
jgi:phenylalanyl-tRNA synthetase beta chain